jgi:peptidyl-prolyl cis-trans isomerase A (cyclophilin A)
MKKSISYLVLAGAFAAAACSPGAVSGPTPPGTTIAPDSFVATISTTEGDVLITAHRDWSPAAVDRFYELVKGDVWSNARIFRVVPGFVAQWGLTGDSTTDNYWRSRRVMDEPVKVSNTRGRVSFARGGPETRTLQVFINLGNNSRLDETVAAGIRGYPPFGEVTQGMDIVDRWESKYAEQPTQLQGEISARGWGFLDERFPGLDRIVRTRVTKEWRQR